MFFNKVNYEVPGGTDSEIERISTQANFVFATLLYNKINIIMLILKVSLARLTDGQDYYRRYVYSSTYITQAWVLQTYA